MPMIKDTMLKRLLLPKLAAGGGGSAPVEATATGNPLTFLTDLARPLKSLLIPFSDENGVTGLTVKHGAKNLLYPAWINFEGQSTLTHGITFTKNADGSITADGENDGVSSQVYYTLTGQFDGDFYICDDMIDSAQIDIYCYNTTKAERVKTWDGTTSSPALTKNRHSIPVKLNSTDTIRLMLRVYTGENVDNVKFRPYIVGKDQTDLTYAEFEPITEHNVIFPVEAGTPTAGQLDIIYGILTVTAPTAGSYQCEPEKITALIGDNTIWSDADGEMTATYLKKAQ